MILYERSHDALKDWEEIVDYTLERHGKNQTIKYTKQLLNCMESIAKGDGYYKDIKIRNRTISVTHCQKHYIFGLIRENKPLMIIALFHERMDLMRRLKKRLR